MKFTPTSHCSVGSETCTATDGGCKNRRPWRDLEDLEDIPVTQLPRHVESAQMDSTAGAQDSGTTTSGHEDGGWTHLGGDGFTAIYHPTNPALRMPDTNGAISGSA